MNVVVMRDHLVIIPEITDFFDAFHCDRSLGHEENGGKSKFVLKSRRFSSSFWQNLMQYIISLAPGQIYIRSDTFLTDLVIRYTPIFDILTYTGSGINLNSTYAMNVH